MRRSKLTSLPMSLALGLSLVLGSVPALAEGELSAEVPMEAPDAASTDLNEQQEATLQTQSSQESSDDQALMDENMLPGPIVSDEYLSDEPSNEMLLKAQATGDGILAGHTEWTALGLFTHILNNTTPGTPEHQDAQAAIDILRGTNASGRQKEVANAINFSDYYDAVGLDCMGEALYRIDTYNKYRAQENKEEGKNLSTNVGTNCRMLAISIAQCDWSRSRIEHSQAYSVSENLSWGYRNPFDGWYTKEKQAYKKNPVWSNETGHYLNIVNPNYNLTGFAVAATGASYGICHEQSFATARADEVIYTTEEFRKLWFNDYMATQWSTGMGATAVDSIYGVHFHADSESNLTRYWGDNAMDTMQTVLRADGATNDYGRTVIVATADGYWDALAAAGLAGTMDAPIIITSTNSLTNEAKAEILRLHPSNILVMGGPLAVSDNVVGEIQAMCSNVNRVYGESAIETAVAIYKKGTGWGKTAIVATSNGYWDALSVGPYAFIKKAPIFLTGQDNRLTSSSLGAIKSGGFDRVIIVGGNLVVSKDVEGQLKDAGIGTIKRLWGQDAIGTSESIAKWELEEEGIGANHVAVATINGYWDALCAAPVCGRQNSVLVLANSGKYNAIATAHKCSPVGSFAHVHVIGGRLALPNDVWNWLLTNAKQK